MAIETTPSKLIGFNWILFVVLLSSTFVDGSCLVFFCFTYPPPSPRNPTYTPFSVGGLGLNQAVYEADIAIKYKS